MRASSVCIAALAVLAAVSPAAAQSVGIYVGRAPYAYDDDAVEFRSPPERSYRDEPRVEIRPSSCGTYHFWNGDYCEDARDR